MYISFFCEDFFALGSKRKPNSQWNIGGVGCLALGLCVGHVHFIFVVLISFASGTQRKPVFWWNMGFSHRDIAILVNQPLMEGGNQPLITVVTVSYSFSFNCHK